MFDRYEIGRQPSSVYHTHTEKRAPTDESVKLLREMEKAAKDEVSKTLRLDFNGLKTVAHFHHDGYNAQDIVVFNIDLNSSRFEERVVLDWHLDGQQRAEKIINAISLRLSQEIFKSSFDAIKYAFKVNVR